MPTLDFVLLSEIHKEHHKDTTQSCHQGIYFQAVVAWQCFNACARTEDEEDIEDIATYHITQRNIAILLERRHARRCQFGQRCTQRHNGQTNNRIAYA